MTVRLRSQLRQHLYLPFVKVLLLILFERRLRREPSSFYLPPRGYKEKGCQKAAYVTRRRIAKDLLAKNLGKRCGSPKIRSNSFVLFSFTRRNSCQLLGSLVDDLTLLRMLLVHLSHTTSTLFACCNCPLM